jgi:predicted nucleotidyltransferase
MDREQVIAILSEMELASRVVRLSQFGSTARREERHDSDVELLAAFDDSRRISLLDVAGIEWQSSRVPARSVEPIDVRSLKPQARKHVEAVAVRAF